MKKRNILVIIASALILSALFLVANNSVFAAGEPDFITYVRENGLVGATLQENQTLSFAFVAVTGLLDGVNPCSIHLMLLLVGYLLLFVKDRKRATEIGFVFIMTIFASYFIFGALLSAGIINLLQSPFYIAFNKIFTLGFAGILTLSALINLKDSIMAKKATLDLRRWESSYVAKRLAHLHFPGTVAVAFVSTLFLLPCSLPLYLGSIHILSRTFGLTETLFYIFIYSLMFVIPLFIVVSVLFRAEQYVNVEDFSPEKYRKLRFIESMAQLIIAAILLFF